VLIDNRELARQLTESIERDIQPENSWHTTVDFNPDSHVDFGKRFQSVDVSITAGRTRAIGAADENLQRAGFYDSRGAACVSAMLAPPWLGPYGDGDRLRVPVGVVVFRRLYLSDMIHMGSHIVLWTIRLVRQKRHARQQRLLRLCRSGQLGQSSTGFITSSPITRRSQQAGLRRLLANAISLPLPIPMHGQHGERRHPQNLAVPSGFASPLHVVSPVLSCGLLWLLVRDWTFAIGVGSASGSSRCG
jgi:hypothetical protein